MFYITFLLRDFLLEIHCSIFILHWTWAKSLPAFHRGFLAWPFSPFKLILIGFKVHTYLYDTLCTHGPLLRQMHQHLRVQFLLLPCFLLLLSAIFSYFLLILILKISLFLVIFNRKPPNVLTNFAVCCCGRSAIYIAAIA